MNTLLLSNLVNIVMAAPLTMAIIVITGITSYQAFNNTELFYKFIFDPNTIQHKKEWYRFWSHGLLHANWVHLILNLFVLFSFGVIVESTYKEVFGIYGSFLYLLLYILGLPASSLFDYFKHRNRYGYTAVGASGAVSAVLFASILFYPTQNIYIYGVIPIPSIIAGVLYLIYSYYMARRGTDNIGHDAHFWGAVWGLFFTAIWDWRIVYHFWLNISNPSLWNFGMP